jgi:hypothetical protein
MKAPTIGFHVGRLDCLICHKEMPLPQSASAMRRTCSCGVVARLVSESTVQAQWGIGLDVEPREGYRTILPYRRATEGGSYIIFEQPTPPTPSGQSRR